MTARPSRGKGGRNADWQTRNWTEAGLSNESIYCNDCSPHSQLHFRISLSSFTERSAEFLSLFIYLAVFLERRRIFPSAPVVLQRWANTHSSLGSTQHSSAVNKWGKNRPTTLLKIPGPRRRHEGRWSSSICCGRCYRRSRTSWSRTFDANYSN